MLDNLIIQIVIMRPQLLNYNCFMAIIKRKYYNGIHYNLDKDSQTLALLPEFHEILLNKKLPFNRGFKKVGGSSLGDVLLTDSFKSQFAAFCNIANLGLPILDEKYIKAGIAIESKVIELIKETSKKEVQVFPPAKYNYDYFANKDDVIGGIPDGFIAETNTVLEIKTTGEKNYDSWIKQGPPISYRKQAAQYTYLMGATKYAIVGTFLKEEDYLDPEHYPIRERRTKNWIYDLNTVEVLDDITKIKKLYKAWTTLGVSPRYNPTLDADLIAWLECASENEWEALKNKWLESGKYKP